MNKNIISRVLFGLSSLSLSNAVFAAACINNTNPIADCDSLLINQSNSTITVPSLVTVSGTALTYATWNDTGAIGTTLINNGTVTNNFRAIIYNGWDSIVFLSRPANVGTINLLSNAGTITGDEHAILNRSTIVSLVNTGSISSTLNNGVYVYDGGSITSLENSGSITATNSYSLRIENTSSIGTLSNLSGGSINGLLLNSGSITTLTNAGTIQGSSSDGLQNEGNIANLNNTGTIKSFGMGGRFGITNSGTISALSNSGVLSGLNSGLSNDLGATITTLINAVGGSIGGGGTGIDNAGAIGALINLGQVTSAFSTGLSNSGTIDVLTNVGRIQAPFGNMVSNSGTITTLNNLNGGITLTFTGTLPTNYIVIVDSPSSYGKLSISPTGSTTTFGIYAGGITGVAASTLAKGTYAAVLTGISAANLNNTTGKYNGFTWTLNNSAGTTWDMVVTGASTADTQTSVQNSASALQKIYTLQGSILANSLTHDCMVFDQKNICIGAGARYTTVESNGADSASALVVAAYRPRPNYRIGLSLDQQVSGNRIGQTLSMSTKMPLIGLFGAWSENQDATGREIKVAAVFGQKDATINRQIVGDSEAGSGSSRLDSQGAQITFKYGLGISERTLLKPYIGIRYSQNSMSGYSETLSNAVTAPLTFASLKSNTTSLLAGVEGRYRLTPETTAFISVGAEHHSRINNGSYSATGIDGLAPEALNANPVRTRGAVTLGGYHDLSKHQRLGFGAVYRQEPVRSLSSTTALLTYTVGL